MNRLSCARCARGNFCDTRIGNVTPVTVADRSSLGAYYDGASLLILCSQLLGQSYSALRAEVRLNGSLPQSEAPGRADISFMNHRAGLICAHRPLAPS